MQKHILFVIDSLGCGGAEKSLLSLLPLIDYSRLDVDLLIFRRGGVFEKYVPSQVNIVEHALYGIRFSDRVKWLLHQVHFSLLLRFGKKYHGAEIHWRSMGAIIKKLEREYDVAVAYQQGLPTFFVASKIKAANKISWINADVYEAGYDMDYCRQFYVQMNHVIPVSESLKEKLTINSPWMADKLTCIYDIVNQELIRRMALEQVEDMNCPKGDVTIVTVGRLAPPKNHLLAVGTALVLKKKGIGFKWYFVGEGVTRAAIEEQITKYGLEDYIILLGVKENPYPYIANADIYVQTSSFEGFGLTIAEAKILHKPIVSTNFDVVYDQIIDGKNGLIADMTPDSVANKILELLNNDLLRHSIVKALEKESNTTSLTEIKKFNYLLET